MGRSSSIPRDPNTVYVAAGLGPLWGAGGEGAGIYKTIDGGKKSWTNTKEIHK